MSNFEQRYMEWLISQVSVGEWRRYQLLLRRLWNKEFYSIVPHDDNRAADGLILRKTWYAEISGGVGEPNFGPCRVLECLFGIAERINYQIFGSKWSLDIDEIDIFWELIDNLGLSIYSDDYLDDRVMGVDTVLSTFLERKYAKDGSGGNIFIIEDTDKNLRKLELWSQMMLYCEVRWPI